MLCRTSLFIFSLCHHVTFYKTLTSLSTVSIKAHVGQVSTTFKVAVSHFVFTHVEPSILLWHLVAMHFDQYMYMYYHDYNNKDILI